MRSGERPQLAWRVARQGALASLVGVTLIATVGCGEGALSTARSLSNASPTADSPADAQQLSLRVSDSMVFEPAALVVSAARPVQLTLTNDGQIPHDFSLAEGVAQPVKISTRVGQTDLERLSPANGRASATFTLPRHGTYDFECSIPGHAALGMRGTITAQ